MPGTKRMQCGNAKGLKLVRNSNKKKQYYFILGLIEPFKEWECIPCNPSHQATYKECVSHVWMTILEAIIHHGAN